MAEALVLYGAAAVLMAIVTALGFNVSDDAKVTDTLNRMVEDLSKATVPGVKIIAGTLAAGLSPNLLYLYMQVVNGKTSVPQNLVSWVQQWLSNDGVYSNGTITYPNYQVGQSYDFVSGNLKSYNDVVSIMNNYNSNLVNLQRVIDKFDVTFDGYVFNLAERPSYRTGSIILLPADSNILNFSDVKKGKNANGTVYYYVEVIPYNSVTGKYYYNQYFTDGFGVDQKREYMQSGTTDKETFILYLTPCQRFSDLIGLSNLSEFSGGKNNTGLSGDNTIGKDVVIPGEGTEGITNEDIVGWLKSAVGQAVSEALGIGTEELQYVPVGIENPALSGEVSDVLANATTQDTVQTGATAVDIVQSGNNTANVTISQNTPVSSVKTSSLYTIWNPTQDQLNSLATFLWSTDFVDLIKKVLQSPMDAMISLALFPIIPKTDGTHIINLGYVPSGVSALRVSDQFQTFQTSGLVIPHKYNSYLDYSPYTTAEIYLPFIGFQRLNINDVMGKTVSVVYNIDMLSGICTALVKVDDNTMYSYSGNMAMFLPLSAGNWARMMTPIFGAVGGVASMGAGIAGVMSGSSLLGSTATAVSGAKSLGNLEGNAVSRSGEISGNAGILGDYQPFIVVTRPINDRPSTYNSNIGQTYNKSVQLGTLSGFTIVDEAHVEGMSATETEKNEIERLLKEGVIF